MSKFQTLSRAPKKFGSNKPSSSEVYSRILSPTK